VKLYLETNELGTVRAVSPFTIPLKTVDDQFQSCYLTSI
jgi:hypothetical protein